MRFSFSGTGLLLALAGLSLAVAGTLTAGQVGPWRAELAIAANDAAGDAADVTGSIEAPAPARLLPLTLEERGRIFDRIIRMRDVPEVNVPSGATAATMPRWVALQDLPA